MDSATIIAIIGALFGAGGIATILKTKSDNKKTEADAEITLTGGWKLLYETSRVESRQEINELRERLAIVEKDHGECKARLAKLETSGGVDIEKKLSSLIQDAIRKREGALYGTGDPGA
jgi:hypothetical protein